MPKSFDLPSESEPRFTVNPDPDPKIEYPVSVSVVIVGVIRRKPVLTHASIVCEGMLASVNSVNSVNTKWPISKSTRV